jgi:hypothetical protein
MDCEIEMHEVWWSCVGLIKLRAIELRFDIQKNEVRNGWRTCKLVEKVCYF